MRIALALSFVLSAVLLPAGGCSSRLVTNPDRSAIEMMLLSGAVDKALARFYVPELINRKVFEDFTNLASYDVEYVRAATRARVCQIGAILVDSADEADYTVEVASGALSLEFKEAVIGLPALPVPNAPVPVPEAPLHRATEQTGIFKLFIFVHSHGKFVAANHYYAKIDRGESFVLWFRSQSRDEVREAWQRADTKLREDS